MKAQVSRLLMFGSEPRLPIDVALADSSQETEKSYTKYVEYLRDRRRKAHSLAEAEAEKASQHQKEMYDRRARNVVLNVDDRVLVRRLAFEGRHKLADRWEEIPYVVLKNPNPNIPVYVVRCEAGGRERTLHRNHLLPIGSIPIPGPKSETPKPKVPKERVKQKHVAADKAESESDDSDSSEEEYALLPTLTKPEDPVRPETTELGEASDARSAHSDQSELVENEAQPQAVAEQTTIIESEHDSESAHEAENQTGSESEAEETSSVSDDEFPH